MYESSKESVENVQEEDTKLTVACFECPFSFDVYSRNGRTPLMIACANGSLDIAK